VPQIEVTEQQIVDALDRLSPKGRTNPGAPICHSAGAPTSSERGPPPGKNLRRYSCGSIPTRLA